MGQAASRVAALVGRTPPPSGEGDPDALLSYSNCIGSFFGTHFLMGGERYELSKPEAYLFGENADLDLLGNKAVSFPYARHPVTDHVRPLNLFVNLRKETLKFIRLQSEEEGAQDRYRIEFTFDADCACCIQMHFNAHEVYMNKDINFVYKQQRAHTSEPLHFDAGAGQVFNHYIFEAKDFNIPEMHFSGGQFFPVLIALTTSGIENEQMQCTMASVDVGTDQSGALVLKPLRQRIASDGVVYLLQEIFGLENKEHADVAEDNGFECIICMTEVRDTLILPCRHLCICAGCAENLRYKLNNCPICRSPFRALLTVKALRQAGHRTDSHNRTQARYETLTIVEALNGPLNHMQPVIGDDDSPETYHFARAQLVATVNEEARETEQGIELTDAKFFVHSSPAEEDTMSSEKEMEYESAEETSDRASPVSDRHIDVQVDGRYARVETGKTSITDRSSTTESSDD